MRDHTRRGVAYIVGRLAGFPSGAVYDHGAKSWVNIAGQVDPGEVHVYDYDRCAHLSGSQLREGLDLFDHGDRSHLQLTGSGTGRYAGYDHATKSHFSVRTHGRDVEVFDFQTRRSYAYSV